MTKNTFARVIVSLGAAGLLLSASVPAFAQTTAAAVTLKAKVRTAALAKIIARGDKAIDARVSDLAALSARIGEMKNISADQKAALTATASERSSSLTALKAKLDADTEAVTAAADEKSILADYRIYALVIPQGHIAAASDRTLTIAALFDSAAAKMQVRIASAQAAGKDVTAVSAALADLNAKIADVKTQAVTAGNSVLALSPDRGDASVAASNKAALTRARADIKVAISDIQAARKDSKAILAGLKAFHLDAAMTASTTVSTNASTTVSQ